MSSKILSFLQTKKAGTTFVLSDFVEHGTYSCIRTSLLRLCRNGDLIRLCQGVYMKPKGEIPDASVIAKEIARRNGSNISFKNEEYKGSTHMLSFYTNGATRNITLSDGTVLKFLHTNNINNNEYK